VELDDAGEMLDRAERIDVSALSAERRARLLIDVARANAPEGRRTAVTDDVKFIRGNDRINRLAEQPDLAPGHNQVREEMEAADREPDAAGA
jgi:hypothetical protein